ncbi:MAG: type II toxin-antitoxin system Phd/YefM family antitoxin [Polyangiales bacterium]
MTQRYSIAEARAHLADIVRDAESGRSVELTRRGKPVAVVVSVEELERLKSGRATFAQAFARYLDAHPRAARSVPAETFDGLRDRSEGREVDL